MSLKNPQVRYQFRKLRTRRKLFGTSERPRLSVFRSSKHIYAQIVDDVKGRTLGTVSSLTETVKKDLKTGATIQAAQKVGEAIAARAKELKITQVIFDRGGRPYHGRIKAVADGARTGGLQF